MTRRGMAGLAGLRAGELKLGRSEVPRCRFVQALARRERVGTVAQRSSCERGVDDALACDGTRGGCGTCGPTRREPT